MQPRPMRSIVIGVAIVLATSASVAIAQSGFDTFFYSNGSRVDVKVADDMIAVQLPASEQPIDLTASDLFDLRNSRRIMSFPEQGIYLLPLTPGTRIRGSLSPLVRALADSSSPNYLGVVAYPSDQNEPLIATDRVVARFSRDLSSSDMQEVLRGLNLELVRASEYQPRRIVARVTDSDLIGVFAAANALYESGQVDYAHPEFYVNAERREQSHDPLLSDQWNLNNTGQGGGLSDADIDAPEAWRITRGSSRVVIAILDDGIEWQHPDLGPNVVERRALLRDFVDDDNDPSPEYPHETHGTAVAGVAVARGNNGIGVSGSCPECALLPIRIPLGPFAKSTDHADAIEYAAANGAWIISNSWGYNIGTSLTDDVVSAINDAATNGRDGLGTVILFAMTNSHIDNCSGATPDISSLPNVIAISGSSNIDGLVGDAGFGACMDLIAPTRDNAGTLGIVTTHIGGQYRTDFGGTSAATPLVAGVAGLLLDLNPRSLSDLTDRGGAVRKEG